MEITIENLRKIAPYAKTAVLEGIVDNIDILSDYEIEEGNRQNMFLAQLAHESDGFKTTREYASGRAYEGRTDLGNTEEGDGVRFRGRGLIQLTGRSNYRQFSAASGVDVEDNPQLVEEFPLALEVSAWFWYKRGLNALADDGDFKKITRRINGGYNGLADRERYLSLIEELEDS